MESNPINVSYTDEFENLLKEESEKAESMGILHSMSSQKYNYLSIFINIPVIVLSSIIGFLSPLSLFPNQAIFLGSLSILVAILKTIDNYFDWTKRGEGHRITGLNYNKISKFIQIQLSLEKECRIIANDLLTIITTDLQNLKDAEPCIPQDVIKTFKIKYKDETTALPPIANGLTKVIINKKLKTPLSSFEVDKIINIIPKDITIEIPEVKTEPPPKIEPRLPKPWK
jgi:hypothetical protein